MAFPTSRRCYQSGLAIDGAPPGPEMGIAGLREIQFQCPICATRHGEASNEFGPLAFA